MYLYRSNRTETLAAELAEVLRVPAGSPFVPEQVVVPSRGMERWLAMQLATRLRVCAHVEFPFPAAAVRQAFDAVLGEAGDRAEAWRAERLSWSVLAVLDGLLDRRELAPLRDYLAVCGEDAHASPGTPLDAVSHKRLQLARRIGDVFDRYATYRPELVLGWDRGEGEGWQPLLWRALSERLRAPPFAPLPERVVQLRVRDALKQPREDDVVRVVVPLGVHQQGPAEAVQVVDGLDQPPIQRLVQGDPLAEPDGDLLLAQRVEEVGEQGGS